jgi:putative ABC transport system permease protein
MNHLAQDIRIAFRSLRRAPALASIAILTLGLGIGLATAVFTVADALLLRRLPIRGQARVVVLWPETPDHHRWGLDLDEAREFARRTSALGDVAFFSYYGALAKPIRDGDRVSRLRRAQVSGGFFDILGVHPALGRVLRPSDDVIGAAPVVVLSYAAWQRRFSGASDVLGRRIQTHDDGMTYTIVGVMPQGLDFPKGTDFWAPVAASTSPGGIAYFSPELVGRLAPGATAGRARDELNAFLGRPEARDKVHRMSAVITPLPQLILGDTKPALFIFAAAAALLLLITCINVANLLLVSGLARTREFAVRSALGGSQRRIVAQLMTESALLATAGGALGIAVAALAVQSFVAFAPAGVPRLDEIHVNVTALAGAVAITALAMLLFGVAPAVTASHVDLHQALRSDVRQSRSRRSRMVTEGLVIGQVALALLVLSSAGLIARSLIKLQGAHLSFEPSHLLIGELALPVDQYDSQAKQLAMLDRLVPRLQALPGVRAVSPVVAVPYATGWSGAPAVEGQSAGEMATNPILNMEVVTPNYFTTFGIPILRGRSFTDADRDGALAVTMVGQSTAQHFWPHADAIGKHMLMGDDTLTIVGIVPDTRYHDLRDAPPSIYFPLRQSPFPFVPTVLAIRTTGPPGDMVPAIRRLIAETEPNLDLANAAPFEAFLAGPLAQPRLNALLLAVFAGAALALAAIGLFGVVATMVRLRTREFGVRMALGATAEDVRRMVLRRGIAIAAAGSAFGLAAALLTNHLLAALLYQVSPTDSPTLGIVSGLLLAVATLASLIPARHATRVDPMISLRAE